MIGIFQGRGIAETARVHAQIDVDMRDHLHVFNNGRNSNALAIFLAIALHADAGGWAWPGRDLIHKETGIGTGHAMSNALGLLREARIDGHRIFAHYRVRDPETKAWGQSAYLIFPELAAGDPPFDHLEEWNPHADNQHVGDQHAGDQHDQVEPSKVEPSKEKDHAAGAASNEGQDDDAEWLKETRIEGESDLEGMTPAEKALVAAPAAPDKPEEAGAPAWETAMRKRLKGMTLPGDFTPDDVVAYCQRFYNLTSNPPPAHNKGNSNWLFGAKATIESFHGSLVTLYESKGQPMPDIERQRRVFAQCVDLFFYLGAGYDHISAPTPRSLANSMASLIGNLVEIHTMYSINGAGIEESHIKGWIARKGDKRGQKTQGARRGGRPTPTDGGVRGPGKTQEENERDLEAARRLIARGT